MKSPAIDMSIIIVNWNVREFLSGCLRSIVAFTRDISFEVIVVDNASTDGSVELVRSEFPGVHLIVNATNEGFAAANNKGLAQAQGRYILFLNPDTELIDNAMKKMVDFMEKTTDASGMGCRLVYGDRTLQRSCRHFPSLFSELMGYLYLDWAFPKSPLFNRYRMVGWAHDTCQVIDVPYGACLLLRRDTLDRVGPFDTRFFMYYDEIDLCRRVRKAKEKIYFVPHITIIHHSNKSSDQALINVESWKAASKLAFFDKHYGGWSIWILLLFLAFQSAFLWSVMSIVHLISGYPKELRSTKKANLREWTVYGKFFKKASHEA